MKLIDCLIAYSKSLFKLNILTFDIYDILFAITHLPNYPVDEDNEPYDLENYGFIEVSDTKIVFYCGGDWQHPIKITVELVGSMPTITNSEIIDDLNEYIDNEIPEEKVYELLNLPNL